MGWNIVLGLVFVLNSFVCAQVHISFCPPCKCSVHTTSGYIICDRYLPSLGVILRTRRTGNYTLILRTGFGVYRQFKDAFDSLFWRVLRQHRDFTTTTTTRNPSRVKINTSMLSTQSIVFNNEIHEDHPTTPYSNVKLDLNTDDDREANQSLATKWINVEEGLVLSGWRSVLVITLLAIITCVCFITSYPVFVSLRKIVMTGEPSNTIQNTSEPTSQFPVDTYPEICETSV